VTDEEKIEKIARELCRAAGQDPDAKVRLGQPLSFAAGDCTIVKPLIVSAWKAYSREARRLSMSDAEHAEPSRRTRNSGRKRRIVRWRASARMLRIVLRRRLRRLQLTASLKEFRFAARERIRSWRYKSRAAISSFVGVHRPGGFPPVRAASMSRSRPLFSAEKFEGQQGLAARAPDKLKSAPIW
jgi:hypothetical protein